MFVSGLKVLKIIQFYRVRGTGLWKGLIKWRGKGSRRELL